MTTISMTDIPDLLLRLKDAEAALGDGRDLRTDNEKADYVARRNVVARTVSALSNLPHEVATLDAKLADLAARRAVVTAKREEIEIAIRDTPALQTFSTAQERDREADRQRHLLRQREHLHAGTLFASPGVPFERLDVLDASITELTKRRDAAQMALDAQLQVAAAVLAAR